MLFCLLYQELLFKSSTFEQLQSCPWRTCVSEQNESVGFGDLSNLSSSCWMYFQKNSRFHPHNKRPLTISWYFKKLFFLPAACSVSSDLTRVFSVWAFLLSLKEKSLFKTKPETLCIHFITMGGFWGTVTNYIHVLLFFNMYLFLSWWLCLYLCVCVCVRTHAH